MAGEDDRVGAAVERVHLLAGHMAQQSDVLLQMALADEGLQPRTFRAFAGDQAFQFHAVIAQPGAGADEKSVVFDGVETSYVHKSERAAVGQVWFGGLPGHIHAQPRDCDLRRIDGEVFENVAAVVFGNREAKAAVPELGIEIRPVQEQVGAVQGQAEIDFEQARGHHGDPGPVVTVVHVDVIDVSWFEPNRVASAQYGVEEGLQLPREGFPSLQSPLREVGNPLPSAQEKPDCLEHHEEAYGLQAEKIRIGGPGPGLRVTAPFFPAAGNYFNSAAAQPVDLLAHVRLDRRGELIGEIGDFEHDLYPGEFANDLPGKTGAGAASSRAARRFCAASIPARVNSNPLTN